MTRLRLTRPLVFFDLETTGTDPSSDRIVEISVLRVAPDGTRAVRTRRVNPERPIPPEAAAVHGIRDADVENEPTFRQIARGLMEFLEGADVAGFNVRRFDLPLLERELNDCGLETDLSRRKIVDVMTVFHRMEPRDLSAAVRFYLGRDHEGAHGAEADVLATEEILEAQLERYDDLPDSVDELDAWCVSRSAGPDSSGKFAWRDGEVVFAFGRHQGKTLREVARTRPDYLEWITRSDFPPDSKAVVEKALRGEYPASPAERDRGDRR